MVPHKRLLKKLDHYGIRGQLIKWIESWLCGRTQTVVVNGSPSSPVTVHVTSGVPQGTVLSFRTLCWRGDLTEGFLRNQFGGLIFGGAYFRNFTVLQSEGRPNKKLPPT